ncbi:hypothetical protein GJ496_004023 [Pomphorhynchus laevis]|nr:hypothetical protein GJ496_004023 [Pomphorhynchus laevis]
MLKRVMTVLQIIERRYDHRDAEVGFIGNVVENEDCGKAEVNIIEDAGICNDVFTKIERNYAHTDSGFNVKFLHIYGDDTGNVYDVEGYDYWSYTLKSVIKDEIEKKCGN